MLIAPKTNDEALAGVSMPSDDTSLQNALDSVLAVAMFFPGMYLILYEYRIRCI